ncbi:hypothetical protein [Acinetobacter junii]|uniref:hypothetical protein n=1 Tax=Acinetobacter junii TaxID=40215 RepID=UPI00124FAD45|nr:hypothetical protein [Acinetobacter junii]
MQTHQQINHYIEDLIHFTDNQSDQQPHRYMLMGFLDAHLYIGAITPQQKQDYLQHMESRLAEKEQQP